MATIDIGKLTFTHKGDYASGTAYVLNDVVYYNGSAYIAKQSTTGNVPTNTTYWSTFTAGSGGIWNSGLSIGSAGQVVKVNSGASALEFGTVSSDYVKLASATASNAANVSFDGYFSNTYTRYILYGNQIYSAYSNAELQFRVNTGGSADTGSHYVQTSHYQYTDNTPSHGASQSSAGNGSVDLDSPATIWELNGDNYTNVATRPANMLFEIHDPSNASNWKQAKFETTFIRSDGNTFQRHFGNGVFKDTTAVTGITIYTAGGNIYGNFALYGIK